MLTYLCFTIIVALVLVVFILRCTIRGGRITWIIQIYLLMSRTASTAAGIWSLLLLFALLSWQWRLHWTSAGCYTTWWAAGFITIITVCCCWWWNTKWDTFFTIDGKPICLFVFTCILRVFYGNVFYFKLLFRDIREYILFNYQQWFWGRINRRVSFIRFGFISLNMTTTTSILIGILEC